MPDITTDWLLTMPAGVANPHGLISAYGYWWVCFEATPGVLVRIDPANPSAYSLVSFPGHGWGMDLIDISSKGKIYVLWSSGATISEVDPKTLAWTDIIKGAGAGNGSLCADGTYLDIGNWNTGALDRYKLSDWSFVGSLNLGLSYDYVAHYWIHGCRYDGSHIYAHSAARERWSYPTNLPKIAKVDPVTFSVVDSAGIPSGDDQLTDDLAFTKDYVWYGSEATGSILRVAKANLSLQTVIPVGLGPCFGVYYDGALIWAVFANNQQIISLDPDSLVITVFNFPNKSLQYSPNEIWNNGDQFCATFFTNPASVSGFTLNASSVTPPALVPVTPPVAIPPAVQGAALAISGAPGAFQISGGTPPYTVSVTVKVADSTGVTVVL